MMNSTSQAEEIKKRMGQNLTGRIPRILRITAFSMIPLTLLAFSAETIARIYKSYRPPYSKDRLTNPAYTLKSWFSKDFLITISTQSPKFFSPPGSRLVIPYDFENKYQTVQKGLRKTTNSVFGTSKRTMMILGGSTTFCSEVPDELTWPSQLQLRLNEHTRLQNIRILNCGVTTVNSSQELERLKYELASGNKPDICVFYNGVNDCLQGVVYNDPEGVLFETAASRESRIIPRLRKASAFVDLLVESTYPLLMGRSIVPSESAKNLSALAERTANIYETNLNHARQICDQHGIALFVFLQPNLYTINRAFNHYEKDVLERQPKAFKTCFDEAYPRLRHKFELLRREGVNAFDLTNIFDANQDPIFLDSCHVESDGNAIIAESVFERMLPYLEKFLSGNSQNPE